MGYDQRMEEKEPPRRNNRKIIIILTSLAVLAAAFFWSVPYIVANKYVAFGINLVEAKMGDADAQLMVGRMYLRGIGVEKNSAEAVKWITRATEQDNLEALRVMALIYSLGDQVPKDDVEALKWYKIAAEKKQGWGADNAGWAYQKGIGTAQDCTQAEKYYTQAYELGIKKAASNIVSIYHDNLCNFSNSDTLFKWLVILAEDGDPRAYGVLGTMYAEGNGTSKDEAMAMKWFKKAVEAKEPYGMYNASRAFLIGMNGEYDLAKGTQYAVASYAAGVEQAMDLVLFAAHKYYEEGNRQQFLSLTTYAAINGNDKAKKFLSRAINFGSH